MTVCTYGETNKVNLPQQFVSDRMNYIERVLKIHYRETCQYLRENLMKHLYQNNCEDIEQFYVQIMCFLTFNFYIFCNFWII